MKSDERPADRRHSTMRVSRRELLRLAALAGAGVGLAGAFDPFPAHAAGTRGGVWRMAIPGNPTAYPITIPGKLVDILVDKTLFSTLVKYELRGGAILVVPDLAESWTANASLTEYTFKLRQDVEWQKGYGEVRASDVKFSYERIAGLTKPKINSPYSGDWSALDRVQVTGPYDGTSILKQPFAPLMHSTLPAPRCRRHSARTIPR